MYVQHGFDTKKYFKARIYKNKNVYNTYVGKIIFIH